MQFVTTPTCSRIRIPTLGPKLQPGRIPYSYSGTKITARCKWTHPLLFQKKSQMFFFFLDLGKGSFSLLKELLVVCQLLAQPVVFCTQSLHLSLQLLLVSLQYVDVGRQCQHQLGKWEGTGCKGQVCGWCVGVYWWWGKKGGSINSERKYLRKYYQSAESSKSQKPLIQSQRCLIGQLLFIYFSHNGTSRGTRCTNVLRLQGSSGGLPHC